MLKDRNDQDLHNNEQVVQSVFQPVAQTDSQSVAQPVTQERRSQIVANLEANSILAEIERELLEAEISEQNEAEAVQAAEPPNKRQRCDTSEDVVDLSRDDVDYEVIMRTPSEYREVEDVLMVGDAYVCSSPVTPASRETIELYVTHKSLYKVPLYDCGVLSLFHNKRNIWVHKQSRPVALDMWVLNEESSRPIDLD